MKMFKTVNLKQRLIQKNIAIKSKKNLLGNK